MILTYIYARSVNFDLSNDKLLLRTFWIFIVINSALMCLQFFTGLNFFNIVDADLYTPSGFSGDPHKNALLMIGSSVFIQAHLVIRKEKILSILLFTFILVALVINGSRAGLLVYVMSTIFLFFTGFNYKNFLLIIGVLSISLLLIILLIDWSNLYSILSRFLPDGLALGLDSIFYKYSNFLTDDSVAERYYLWGQIFEMSTVDTLKIFSIGLGPGTFDGMMGQTMHNTALDIIVSVGVIGFLAIASVIYRTLRLLLSRRDSATHIGLAAIVVAFVLFSMFHDFGRGRFLWLFLGLGSSDYYRNWVRAKGKLKLLPRV